MKLYYASMGIEFDDKTLSQQTVKKFCDGLRSFDKNAIIHMSIDSKEKTIFVFWTRKIKPKDNASLFYMHNKSLNLAGNQYTIINFVKNATGDYEPLAIDDNESLWGKISDSLANLSPNSQIINPDVNYPVDSWIQHLKTAKSLHDSHRNVSDDVWGRISKDSK